MRFERLMRTIFLALAFLLLFQTQVFAQDNGSTIRVGIFQNHPIVFIDDNGVPQGLYIDLLREIASAERWDIQFVPGTWSEGLERLRSAEIDLMTSIAYLDEREVYMDFSHENVLTMWGQVYVHQDSEIQNILDLQGETVAILNGGINGINFMDMVSKFDMQCDFRVVGTYTEVAELVASGDVAAGVINNVHGYEQEKQYMIKRSPIIFNPFSLLFAVSEGENSLLLETIDSYLVKWKSDSESPYYSSTAKWFGQIGKEAFSDWIFRALFFAVGILLLVAVWVFVLRRQVKNRTKELIESREVLQKHREHLEELVEERTAELTVANAKLGGRAIELKQINIRLKELDRLKSTFIDSVSHELRTPLVSIKGYTELIRSGRAGKVPKKISEMLVVIERNADRLSNLTEELLDQQCLESGRLEISPEPIQLQEVVKEVVQEVQPFVSGKSQVLNVQVLDDLPLVNADRIRISQVLINLLNNASKFTPKKGSINLQVKEAGEMIEVQVSDTGIGIAKEDLPKLFKPFLDIQKPDITEPSIGLGLSICKGIVDLHGGKIWAESKGEDKGTTFTFTIPKYGGG